MSSLYPDATITTTLRDWNSAADEALALEEYQLAAQLSQVVLRRLPRHLPSYQRLITITWHLKRWDEGEDWGRRLLQADPANAAAWRSLGRAAEQRDLRSQAHSIYQRAFEVHPYDPDVRAGLSRTGVTRATRMADRDLSLNLACLGSLYLRGRRWGHAVETYRTLVQAEPRRSDFQVLLCFALWQQRAHKEAYQLARHLTHAHPNLLLAWIVLSALGNERDRALARNPLQSMDPDGAYARQNYDLPAGAATIRLAVTRAEARLLEEFIQAAGFVDDLAAGDDTTNADADASAEELGDMAVWEAEPPDERTDTEAGFEDAIAAELAAEKMDESPAPEINHEINTELDDVQKSEVEAPRNAEQ